MTLNMALTEFPNGICAQGEITNLLNEHSLLTSWLSNRISQGRCADDSRSHFLIAIGQPPGGMHMVFKANCDANGAIDNVSRYRSIVSLICSVPTIMTRRLVIVVSVILMKP